MGNYLLEIGLEEVPARFCKSLGENIKNEIEKQLKDKRITYNDIQTKITYRRVAITINELAETQSSLETSVNGPPVSIAFNEDKTLSKAGIGFLKKTNSSETELKQKEDIYWENQYGQFKWHVTDSFEDYV